MYVLGSKLTLEQRVDKSAMAIMAHPKWSALAGVIMVGKRRVSETDPTARTDGVNVTFGRAFFDKLSDAELRFVDVHEQFHKMYRHLTTWAWMWEENPQLANQACDFVINIKISDADDGEGFLKMPPMGCIDAKYRGMDSAQVFHLLKQGGGGKGGSGFDEHDWEAAHAMTDEEKREVAKDIDEAIRQGALAAGKAGSGGDRVLEELIEAQVDWREALRDFVTTTCAGSDYSTWSRPNRRYVGMGIYMPSGVSERIGELVIAIDTSGSIGGRQLSVFLSEVVGICDTVKPEAVRILYWDTKVYADERYEAHELHNLTKSTKPAGGGGTTVECVPEYITQQAITAQAVIVLTDGYLGGSWGSWSTPVLWCVLDNKSANPSVGKAVHIKSHDLR